MKRQYYLFSKLYIFFTRHAQAWIERKLYCYKVTSFDHPRFMSLDGNYLIRHNFSRAFLWTDKNSCEKSVNCDDLYRIDRKIDFFHQIIFIRFDKCNNNIVFFSSHINQWKFLKHKHIRTWLFEMRNSIFWIAVLLLLLWLLYIITIINNQRN